MFDESQDAHGHLTGMVFDIKRFAVHDGPGIRTTVFLKGCPLDCVWCHNPESKSSAPEISFMAERCIGCGLCVEACPHGARDIVEASAADCGDTGGDCGRGIPAPTMVYDRSRCVACGACARVCPTTATELVGQQRTVDEIWAEVAADRPFYEHSGGGLTISGGEPLAQFEFTLALAERARREDVHVCLDTSGYASAEELRSIAPLIDLFLFDIKETDSARHKKSTGVGNETIFAALRLLDELGRPLVLRCPIIPGVNMRDGYLAALAELYKSLKSCQGLHVMPYHNLAASKYARLGIPAPESPAREPGAGEVESWIAELERLGVEEVSRS